MPPVTRRGSSVIPPAPADLSPHTVRAFITAGPVMRVLAVLMMGALIAAALGPIASGLAR